MRNHQCRGRNRHDSRKSGFRGQEYIRQCVPSPFETSENDERICAILDQQAFVPETQGIQTGASGFDSWQVFDMPSDISGFIGIGVEQFYQNSGADIGASWVSFDNTYAGPYDLGPGSTKYVFQFLFAIPL